MKALVGALNQEEALGWIVCSSSEGGSPLQGRARVPGAGPQRLHAAPHPRGGPASDEALPRGEVQPVRQPPGQNVTQIWLLFLKHHIARFVNKQHFEFAKGYCAVQKFTVH